MADTAQGQIRVKLQGLYARITEVMRKKEHHKALGIFDEVKEAYAAYQEGPKLNHGSVEFNTIEHSFCTIKSLLSSSLSCEVSRRRDVSIDGRAGPHLLTSEAWYNDLSDALVLALDLSHQSLAWTGISDPQRFYGHCCRATAYANMGDFLTELYTVQHEYKHATILDCTVRATCWADGVTPTRYYKNAAQDAFYAAHISGVVSADVGNNLVERMRALRVDMCAKLGVDADEHLAQMNRAGLARFQLPILGLWEGDPTLCEFWGPFNMTIMALFRRRDGSGGANSSNLYAEFYRRGIRWINGERGQILFVNTDDDRLHPTWVVPDDTRAGLRAAGLTGDMFELARR